MLFRDKLDEFANLLNPEFDKLFDRILKTQTHNGDLLLVKENGLYNTEVYDWGNLPKLSPYMIGPDWIGHSDRTHYDFIHNYRVGAICPITLTEYIDKLEQNDGKNDDVMQIQQMEIYSIQIEMLIYLKVWEADAFLKRFYGLAQLLNKSSYDWHFEVPKYSRSKFINNEVRNKFKNEFPVIFNTIKNTYIGQLRNSIAHSNYSILQRSIYLNNYFGKSKDPKKRSLSFENWIDIFHYTIILHNEMLRFFNKVEEHYKQIAVANNYEIEVRINRKDPNEVTEYNFLEYISLRPEFGRWAWKNRKL